MALRTRLAVSDVLHRGLVWSLLGVSVWGIVMMGVVHRETLKAGREALARQEALGPVPTVVPKDEDEKHEVALAEAAIAALKNRSNRA
ncbi:uncharacterized protein TRAVEDRAFT_31209 [Trametes versicolor FP-101664 SS1]|uniref:uncharacterized protein n=1 Tax=Trametes versicolor (strain FP-101664) TaxID=717944 RepID=UPI0004623777|nr:uncharacterized protein TRAVEDRAFT_31209 [Trametes versicolor FP-101664 SS1]EIW54022.1 hypothetical protein TRAVEDRAFT_31209 [Trametes versicolor FP-101664 SS1]